MLTDVNRWYKDAKAYKDECTGARYHGFLQKYPKTPTVAVEADFYSHAQYCTLVDLWQIRLLEVRLSALRSPLTRPSGVLLEFRVGRIYEHQELGACAHQDCESVSAAAGDVLAARDVCIGIDFD